MILTITTTHAPATDMGYLLHKNPARLHEIELSFGKALVFYPEATEGRCTAALALEIDPVALVRKEGGWSAAEEYVNDRPYVASSFLSVALAQAFGTLLSGKSKERPELLEKAIPLEARIPALPCNGNIELARRLFEPLGYEVEAERPPLDEAFPEWGGSPYLDLTLRAVKPLRDLLIHLYVLIPTLDGDKHYWIGEAEVEKLVRYGEGWLASHPAKDLIARRYLRRSRPLARLALDRLADSAPPPEMEAEEAPPPPEEAAEAKIGLHEQRLTWTIDKLKALGARRVADLGCGEGKLLRKLVREAQFTSIVGADISIEALERAREKLPQERLPLRLKDNFTLLQSALTYQDKRLKGADAAVLVEVIEHLDPPRLEALTENVFGFLKPGAVLITTPNAEYNALFPGLAAGGRRHADHRFEWSRAEFQAWALAAAARHGYDASFEDLGPVDPALGAPTQAGVFVRHV